MVGECAVRIDAGKFFHASEAATWNVRSPTVESWAGETIILYEQVIIRLIALIRLNLSIVNGGTNNKSVPGRRWFQFQ